MEITSRISTISAWYYTPNMTTEEGIKILIPLSQKTIKKKNNGEKQCFQIPWRLLKKVSCLFAQLNFLPTTGHDQNWQNKSPPVRQC